MEGSDRLSNRMQYGRRYFATRDRLGSVVSGVRVLGEEVGVDVAHLEDEGEFLAGLRDPFVFVVCGEINAGKSSVLNGLFGEDFCEVGELPTTDEVKTYVFGEKVRKVSETRIDETWELPFEFLREYE